MKIHLHRLLLLCVLLLLLPMAAFAEEAELPVEWVRYGYGMPNPAPVDAHELTGEAITLEGIAYAPKLENGRVYVRLEDLAAAKLVRENAEALQQLGLSVSDLQLENGHLKAPGKEDALAQFLSAAAVGVSVNDSFTLANAGEGKLIIRIAGFASKDDTAKAGDTGVQVAARGEKDIDTLLNLETERPSTTTVYVYYRGKTRYRPAPSPLDSDDDQEQSSFTRETQSTYFIGIAYSQEDLDNGVRYYLTLDKENPTDDLTFDIVAGTGPQLSPGDTYEALDIADKTVYDAYSNGSLNEAYHKSQSSKLFPTIRLSTDPEGKNVIKDIHFEDKTPEAEAFLELGEYGYYLPNTPSEDFPEDYHFYDRVYSESSTYVPDNIATVTVDPADSTDVTIEIRDVVEIHAPIEGGEPD